MAATAGGPLAPTFVDAFAGCGGLSYGLMRAGWRGLFAIEKDPFAFDTLSANLLNGDRPWRYVWPDWLPRQAACMERLVEERVAELTALRGRVTMLVGGPPCQGFSSAGRRDPKDPRNLLFASYLRLVELLRPALVLVENVRGITADFAEGQGMAGRVNYADLLVAALSRDYEVTHRMLDLSTFGVPQRRTRFVLVGVRRGVPRAPGLPADPLEALEAGRLAFVRAKGLPPSVAARAALSDLELARNQSVPCDDSPGFDAIGYRAPRTQFQRLMRDGERGAPSDTRLARHRPEIEARFKQIIKRCHAHGRLNVSLSTQDRTKFGLKKMATRVLDPDRPAPTVTSMPDDLLHYAEPRTLTVRENARLQTFPDWYVFRGKYTTGGHLRRKEVPRFTQVANAVPPLAAEAIGATLLRYAPAAPVTVAPASVEPQVEQLRQCLELVAVLQERAPDLP